MQVASDLLATAIEAIIQALVLIGILTGAVVWQAKRGKKEDPRDQLVKQLNEDIHNLTQAVREQGQRISYLEGRSNGQTPRH